MKRLEEKYPLEDFLKAEDLFETLRYEIRSDRDKIKQIINDKRSGFDLERRFANTLEYLKNQTQTQGNF